MLKETNMTDIFIAPKHAEKLQKSPAAHTAPHAPRIPHRYAGMSILSSFREHPKGIFFQNQKSDETILLFLRAHIITNFSWVIISVFLIILPTILLIVLPMFGVNIFSSLLVVRFGIVYVFFYYLLVFSYAFTNFLHWFYNVFIVTTDQIVDVDYSNIVVNHMAVTNISQIQDAKYTQTGFIATFFNFGNISVQTAGTEECFEESAVPKPKEAAQIIGSVIGKRQKFLK